MAINYGNWNYGTGRRKSSVARVFIKSGKGELPLTVNLSMLTLLAKHHA